MQWKYYIGTGPEADEILDRAESRRKTVFKKRRELMDEYGAEGLILSNGFFDHGTPVALGYRRRPDDLSLFKQESKCEDGWYYYPRLSTKKGKELAKKLADPDIVFDRSDFILDCLGLHTVEHGKYIGNGQSVVVTSQAAYGQGKILVKIPCKKEDPQNTIFAKIPSWLREVKESEFLAAQGK